jgi:phosphoenolpyruvate carboxykinase (ATP)
MSLKTLQSISKSLSSTYRQTGPRLYSDQTPIPVGGSSIIETDIAAKNVKIYYNLSPAGLYEHELRLNVKSHLCHKGALVVESGVKTGRSPKDKRVVKTTENQDQVWWSHINIPMDMDSFLINRETATNYLNTRDQLFVFDGYAGWNPKYRLKIRVICERPYHALFMHNMLIRPTEKELEDYNEPDWVIYNAGTFPCNRFTGAMSSSTSVDLCFERKEFLILGTQYAGEMKKGIFSIMHYLMPPQNVLSLHSSANLDLKGTSLCLYFGLSGTGKTTLSADPERILIGDDEHCWSDDGVFNIEGGCYAKCIGLDKKKEPEIWGALKFGALLENVVINTENRKIDFDDASLTENTRLAYPLTFLNNVKLPSLTSEHPKNIIFLTCDAFGVFPLISRLTPEQAIYHFLSGYTAKIPGTEIDVKTPILTFSACFGEAFLVRHPIIYGNMLKKLIETHNTKVWLLNTGWINGSYGSETAKRCPLNISRKLVNMIHKNEFDIPSTNINWKKMLYFNLEYPDLCIDNVFISNQWSGQESVIEKLATSFKDNMNRLNMYNLPGGPK